MSRLISLFIFCLAGIVCSAQSAEAYGVYLKHNVVEPGSNRQMLQVHFKLKCSGIQGHEIIPVMFIDKEKEVGHQWDNGGPMKQDGATYTATYPDTYWEGDNWVGIYNDRLNPLPGKHTYWVRVLIWDKNLNRYIGDLSRTEWVTFDFTGPEHQHQHQPQPQPQQDNTCTRCGGVTAISCTRCGGRGQVYVFRGDTWVTCNMCQGVGHITCPNCGGSGLKR